MGVLSRPLSRIASLTLDSTRAANDATLTAVERCQAVIAFAPDGRILSVNPVFAQVMGYSSGELTGAHHGLLVPPAERDSDAYRSFWTRLAGGESISGRFARRTKDGRTVWLQASYAPITDGHGRVVRVVKVGFDVTAAVAQEAESAARLAAIDRSMAVIAFDLEGRILEANPNFLAAVGYDAAEIIGRPHAMFVLPGERDSAAYRDFWSDLRAGRARAGRFLRVGKGGRAVWIEASYNPVLGVDGRPAKVVKFATDITAQQARDADARSQLAAIDKVQAVIEFNLDGTIVTANDNFLHCTGYTLDEIRGRHHRMFVSPAERESEAYARFWARISAGEPLTGQYQRVAKDGRTIHLQASYNPIFGADGKPYKAIKYATDVTTQVELLRSLRTLVAEVVAAAGAISDAAGEMNAGNNDLAARTESAAASLEETAASMEELTATVKCSSDNARHASRLADGAAQAGTRGTAVVASVNDTMREIQASSRRIEEIIGVIDGVAFQTNILALNAAVEAARAGEQGRGFAVVASEVRALAQRCSLAAKDIKGLIVASAASVRAGTDRVAEAGRVMAEFGVSIQELSGLMRDIAASAGEQAAGIEQVNAAVMSLDQGTQQNAALVEEAAAATRALDEQAAGLLAKVRTFMAANGLDAGTASPQADPPTRAGAQRLRAVK